MLIGVLMMKKNSIRDDFPILSDNKFAYLDSGATSQKPKCVLNCMIDYYKTSNANAHRGAYSLSIKASQILEEARHKVKEFLNAKFDEEIIFTKNATESLNLFAYSYALNNLNEGDEVVLSILEHHSMIVPLQKIASQKKAKLKFLYLNDDYQINTKEIEEKITKKTKIVGLSTVSNVLGTITDYQNIIKKAHSVGAVTIIDASQSIAHMPFDVQKTDADFVVFSAHKMYGPLGMGILYGKKELLEAMPPFLFGGDMIEYFYEDHTTYAPLPNKFEAGTQNVSGALGIATAIDYIKNIGYENIEKIENDLIAYAKSELSKLPFVKLYTTSDISNLSSVISFNVKGVHPHDVASILDMENVFIRAGNHCAQPLLRFLKLDGTCRLSVSIYNTREDIDKLIDGLKKVHKTFEKYMGENHE